MKIKTIPTLIIILLLPSYVAAIIDNTQEVKEWAVAVQPRIFHEPGTHEEIKSHKNTDNLLAYYSRYGLETKDRRSVLIKLNNSKDAPAIDESKPDEGATIIEQQEILDESDEDDETDYLVEINGFSEIAYSSTRSDDGDEESKDLFGSLDVTLNLDNKVLFYTSMLQDINNDLSVDEAIVAWSVLPDDKLDLLLGKQYLPFGIYLSNMITFPFTYDLGITNLDKVLQATIGSDLIEFSGYIFEGNSRKTGGAGKHKNGFGLSISHFSDAFEVGAGFLSNLAESEGALTQDVAKKIPALSINGSVRIGNFALIGEHVSALKPFLPDDLEEEITEEAKPSANHLELNLILPNSGILALMWTESNDAEELEFSKSAFGATYTQPIYKYIYGGIEIIRDRDYDGFQETTFSIRISVDFEAFY